MTEEEVNEAVRKIVAGAIVTREHYIGSATKGGQQTNGTPPSGCTVTHPDFNIVVFYNERRAYTDNAIHALSLFATAIKGMNIIPDN